MTIGAAGVFSPDHVYLRPGSIIRFTNIDTKPHRFLGIGSAIGDSGAIAPGKFFAKTWTQIGTWTYRDEFTSGGPIFTAVDVPK